MFWTFLCTFLSWTNLSGKGRPLALRERWDVVYQYSGRGWRQTVVTEGRVEDELLVRKEGWEVIVLLNTTDWWSFHWSIQVILIGFSTDYFMSKFLRWAVPFLDFFVMQMRNWYLNTRLKLLLKISPIPVFDLSLLSHACAC